MIHEGVEFLSEIIADGRLAVFLGYGERVECVYELVRLVLTTCRACAATIAIMAVVALYILGQCASQSKLAAAFGSLEQQRVRQSPAVHHLSEIAFDVAMSGNVGKSHDFQRFCASILWRLAAPTALRPYLTMYSLTSWKRSVAKTKSLSA